MLATDEQAATYHNQTAILSWLRSLGHDVTYVRDRTVPSIHNPPRVSFVGKPCPYCRTPMSRRGARGITNDHAHIPKHAGGSLVGPNRVVCCYTCNNEKGPLTLKQWHERLYKKQDPRARFVQDLIRE